MATSAACGTSLMTCACTSCMCRHTALEIVNMTGKQADADLKVRRARSTRFALCYPVSADAAAIHDQHADPKVISMRALEFDMNQSIIYQFGCHRVR